MKSAYLVVKFTTPFHTLEQSVPLTLSRTWNVVHFVLVKLVTHNVYPHLTSLPS